MFRGYLCRAGVTDKRLLTPCPTCGVLAAGSAMGLPRVPMCGRVLSPTKTQLGDPVSILGASVSSSSVC